MNSLASATGRPREELGGRLDRTVSEGRFGWGPQATGRVSSSSLDGGVCPAPAPSSTRRPIFRRGPSGWAPSPEVPRQKRSRKHDTTHLSSGRPLSGEIPKDPLAPDAASAERRCWGGRGAQSCEEACVFRLPSPARQAARLPEHRSGKIGAGAAPGLARPFRRDPAGDRRPGCQKARGCLRSRRGTRQQACVFRCAC